MRWLLLVVLLSSACSLSQVQVAPDGTVTMRAFALGHAFVERRPDGTIRNEGGALSSTAAELFANLVSAAAALYAGGVVP